MGWTIGARSPRPLAAPCRVIGRGGTRGGGGGPVAEREDSKAEGDSGSRRLGGNANAQPIPSRERLMGQSGTESGIAGGGGGGGVGNSEERRRETRPRREGGSPGSYGEGADSGGYREGREGRARGLRRVWKEFTAVRASSRRRMSQALVRPSERGNS